MKTFLGRIRVLVALLLAVTGLTASAANTATVTSASSSYSSAGGTVTFTVNLGYTTSLAALDMRFVTPAGWKYVSTGGTNVPQTAPSPDDLGSFGFDFLYSVIPANAASFSFTLSYPAGLSANQVMSGIVVNFTDETTGVPAAVPVANITLMLSSAPTITSASSATFLFGQSNTFTVTAGGSPAPTLTMTGTLPGGVTFNSSTSALSGSPTAIGSFPLTFTATNGNSPAATQNFTLTVNPTIASFTPASGGPGTQVTINGAGFTGAAGVRFNGVDAASFSIVSDFQITAQVPALATTGPISVVRGGAAGTLTATPAFIVTAGPRLRSMASRVNSTTGDAAVLQSFSIHGTAPKPVLIRAAGPALAAFGITGTMANPFLSLYNSAGAQIATNDNWGLAANAAEVSGAASTAGAFPFASGSLDAAILTTLQPGTYTARVTPGTSAAGVVLLEVYETDAVQRIAHLSSRSHVGTGSDIKISGFTLGGATGSNTVLVRAVGAGLGLPGSLANSMLTIRDSANAAVATNDNWGSAANLTDLTAATTLVGAMPLATNDSAVLVTLPAGNYTVEVSGVGNTTGVAMTEVFLVDSVLPASFPPALLAPLHSQTPALNGTVVFTAPFVAKPAPTFQWQSSPTLAGTYTDLAGQTGRTLTLANVTSANNGFYRVVLTNTAADGTAVTSAAAEVGVAKAAQTIAFSVIPAASFSLGGTVTISATASSGLPVSFVSSNTAIATIGTPTVTGGVTSVTVTILDVGSPTITASQGGSADFAAASDATQLLTINKGNATLAITGLAATFDFTAKPVTVTTTPASLPVDVTYTPAGGTATATPPIDAGTYSVVATVNHNHYQGTRTETLVIAKANQTIAFTGTELASKTFGDAPFTIAASADSTAAVGFTSSDPSVATVSGGNTITILTGGTTTITATQAGNGNFNAAPPIARTLTIAKAAATVVLSDLTHTYNGAVKGAGGVTTPVGLALSFTYTPPGGTPSTTAPVNAGDYGVTATIVDNRYQGSAGGVITINKAAQTIAFDPAMSVALDQSPVALLATATGGPVTFSISNASPGTVATLNGSTLTLVNTGTIDITASAAANSNYNAATSVTRTLTITGQSQTITFDAAQLPAKTYSPGQTFSISAASNRSGYLISFTTSDANVATIATGTLGADSRTTTATVTIVGAGTATITATQAGDANTGTATPVPRALTVAKAAATVTLTPATLAQVFNNTPRAVTATTVPTNLNLAFTYTPTGGTASATPPTAAGTYAVTAAITGTTPPESNYAGSANGTLVIAKAPQTITFADILSPKLVNAGAFSLTASSDAITALPITFTSSNPAVARIDDVNIATILILGTTTITAKQPGDANYLPAADVAQILEVRPLAPVITAHPALAQTLVVGGNFAFGAPTLNAFSSPVTFTLTGTLPAGLTASSVNSTTGAINGVVTGTPGIYNLVLTATNATGFDTKTIVLTLNPPAPVFTSPASVTGTVATAGFTYTAVATNAASYTLTGTLPPSLTFANGVISGTPSQAGTFPVTITATNVTGSVSLDLVIRIVANPNSPVVTSSALVNGQVGVLLNYQLTSVATGTSAAPTTYAVAGALPNGLTLSSSSGAVSGTPAASSAGTYTVHFAATNSNGTGLPLAVTFVIAPAADAPVITSNGSAAGHVGQLFSYTIAATGSPTSYTATNLPSGLSLSGAVISGTPTAETPIGAPANVTLTATNATGTSNPKTLLITVTAAPGTPVITSGLTANLRVGVASNYTIASAPATTSFAATGLPSGLTLSGATISGTPTQSGTFEVTLRGANAAGVGPASTLVLNIAPPLSAPTITSPAGASGTVGASFTYNIVATPAPISVYAVSGTLPLGLSLDPSSGAITGTPSVSGLKTVEITATGAGGTSLPQTLVINIAAAAGVPVITSPGTVTGRAGQPFAYTITATNVGTAPYAPSVLLEAIHLPAGLAANPSTGLIQGVPTTVGITTASLVGTNAAGTGPSRALLVSIEPAATAPVISGATLSSAQAGVPFAYTITASPAATSFEVLGAPSWLTLNSASGALGGTPTLPGQVQVQLIAHNTAGASLPVMLTINVAAAANTPVITSSRTAAGTVGVVFSGYTATASATPITSYLAIGLPPGLALDPATGAITGTPTSSGTFPVSISATNASGVGAAVTVTFTIARSVTFGL